MERRSKKCGGLMVDESSDMRGSCGGGGCLVDG